MKYLLVTLSLLVSFAARAEKGSEISDPRMLVMKFLNNELPSEYQQPLAEKIEGLKHLTRKAGDNVFLCAGYKLNALVGGTELHCSTLTLQTFKVETLGVELAVELSANIIVGYGHPEEGIHPLNFSAGLYGLLGGMVMTGGGINMGALGIGIGGHVNYGVPADSLFGGQLRIHLNKGDISYVQ
jgi:hypothetical protein